MNTVSTGIAVALALVVIAFFFLPGLSPFRVPAPTEAVAPGSDTQIATTTDTASVPQDAAVTTQSPSMPQNITSLEIKDIVVGAGAVAKPGDMITVNYVGMLTNGTVFDASANHGSTGFPFVLGTGQVIKGWDEGIVGMKVGGKRELLIPADLAYGSQGAGDVIPPNAALLFEVELLKVGQ